ncbi:hypothetical protein [Flagellimonas sediminis]|uniref:Uncharacterized protein n=1 Tax=Flagellimonas sediminis TaxID=2696468 RepID=A0A6I5KXM2_9FLAO|nr:hypothetical protein [Allomuricauda sediminis]NDV43112.1 hypothetical protein [Allomuricauda sediminis]
MNALTTSQAKITPRRKRAIWGTDGYKGTFFLTIDHQHFIPLPIYLLRKCFFLAKAKKRVSQDFFHWLFKKFEPLCEFFRSWPQFLGLLPKTLAGQGFDPLGGPESESIGSLAEYVYLDDIAFGSTQWPFNHSGWFP